MWVNTLTCESHTFSFGAFLYYVIIYILSWTSRHDFSYCHGNHSKILPLDRGKHGKILVRCYHDSHGGSTRVMYTLFTDKVYLTYAWAINWLTLWISLCGISNQGIYRRPSNCTSITKTLRLIEVVATDISGTVTVPRGLESVRSRVRNRGLAAVGRRGRGTGRG